MSHIDGTPNANDLGGVILNPVVRAWIYGTFVVLLVIAGAITAALVAIHVDLPVWLLAAQGALTYLGIPVGGLAIANVKKG